MPSPFPGMDPYLESHWRDVQSKLVAYAADELNRVLPPTLVARSEERIGIESDWSQQTVLGPDVRAFEPRPSVPTTTSSAVIDAPFKLVVELEPMTERFIKILDRGGELISVIEFISPTNKASGLEAYRTKRDALLSGGVQVMEIDLVRQGNWGALMRPHSCPPQAVANYRATIRTLLTTAYLFPIPLQHRLPDIPVPLRPTDPRVVMPLQQLLEALYQNGRYALTLDYSQPCEPPLDEQQREWARQLLDSEK